MSRRVMTFQRRPATTPDPAVAIVVTRLLSRDRTHLIQLVTEIQRPVKDWTRIRSLAKQACVDEHNMANHDHERQQFLNYLELLTGVE